MATKITESVIDKFAIEIRITAKYIAEKFRVELRREDQITHKTLKEFNHVHPSIF